MISIEGVRQLEDVLGTLAAAFGWPPSELDAIPLRDLEVWTRQAERFAPRKG